MKKLKTFAKNNYFIIAFFLIIMFVGVVSSYKLFFNRSQTYIYVKAKIGQGLWWAGGAKPSIWLAKGIQKGNTEKDLLGNQSVEVLQVTYYPWYSSDQFDVFLTLKLKVGGNSKRKTYTFKRSTIGIGSPIELELPSYQVNGTIIDLSDQPFEEKYIEKTVYLVKRNAYPWEYDAIKPGDTYFDGQRKVFEIMDKSASDTYGIFSERAGSDITSSLAPESRKYVTVKTKMTLQQKDNQLIYGQDQLIRPGKIANISTSNFTFTDYVIGKIE